MRKVGDEYVIVKLDMHHVNFTQVISLNPTAAWIWENFGDRDFIIDDVLTELQRHFRLEDNQMPACRNDVEELFVQFGEIGLIDNAT